MLRAKLSCVPAWMLFGLAALLHGCSTTTVDNTAGWSPNKIYSEAKDEMDSGAYSKAIPLLEKLEGRAAGTPLAQQAQLDCLADWIATRCEAAAASAATPAKVRTRRR